MNPRILLFALAFGLVKTAYFGWNFFPASDAEIICDGITIIIGALALVVPPSGQS